MHFVSDLHLHSKYSRAVSPSMTLPVMAQYAQQKGIDILTASDWTHPVWFKEIQAQLEEAGEGIYKLRNENGEMRNGKEILFLLSTEISCIYKQGDKLRRIHNLIFVPNLETAEKISKELVRRGCNLSADGRPIVGLSSKNLYELVLSINDHAFLIPCHVWTPHFGVYGSASGFDSLKEAFEELEPYIYGIETGLSSDPDMNWQVAELNHRAILSFSDAHSAPKMAREATVFDLQEANYESIREAIMQPSRPHPDLLKGGGNKIAYTIEFYPEEGKYHFSGHRNCKVVQGPEALKESGGICPVCHRRLTEGVYFRVQQLSDDSLMGRAEIKKDEQGLQWFTDKLYQQPPYVKLVPLLEVVAEGLSSTVASQKSKNMFAKLCNELESELNILLKAPIATIEKVAGWRIAEGVKKVRAGDIEIDPGYDGEYGKVAIWKEGETKETKGDSPQLSFDL
jgi:uncharacterized protein (TIGR00375 family)